MWRLRAITSVVGRMSGAETVRAQYVRWCYNNSTMIRNKNADQGKTNSKPLDDDGFNSPTMPQYSVPKPLDDDGFNSPTMPHYSVKDSGTFDNYRIGQNVPKKDKVNFMVTTIIDLKDDKEAVYGALDAWVAWERDFPIGLVKRAIEALEKEQQWHKIVQVIKWMLSKGQGTTMGTYGQLIRALDRDHRAEEADEIWAKKVGYDLHSVPWQLCNLMMCVYHRNNMPEKLIKLFKDMEAYDRRVREKSIVQRVADTYEMLGLVEEKEQVLEKYNELFIAKEPRRNPFKLKTGKRDPRTKQKKKGAPSN